MRAPIFLALFALLVAGATLAMQIGTQSSDSHAADTALVSDPHESAQVAALRDELASLRAELEAVRAQPTTRPAASGRSEVIDVEAAVRAVLAEEGLLGADGVAARAAVIDETTGEAITIDDLVAMLLVGDLNEDEWNSIWNKARAAGLSKELIAAFEERAELSPNDAEAQAQVGFAYLSTISEIPDGPEKGAWGMKADAAFDRALEIDPNHWEARSAKAFSLSFWPPIFGKQAEAISNFEILVEKQGNMTRSSKHARTFIMLGNLYQQTGQQDKAAAIWAQGAQQFPDNAELLARTSGTNGN